MTLLSDLWPAGWDDSGDGRSGYPLNLVFFNAIKAAIDDKTHSLNNPTVKPKTIIDEVVTARAAYANLDARLDAIETGDGAEVISASNLSSVLGATNLVANDDFQLWSLGDAAVPDHYTLSGTPTIARCGTGLGDTTRKIGDFCAKLTYGAATGKLIQTLIPSGSMTRADILKGRKIGIGWWVKSGVANHARICIDDGVAPQYSDYHTGDNTWQFLTKLVTLSAAATKIEMHGVVEQGGGAYFSGPTVIISDYAPAYWIPCPTGYGFLHADVRGTAAVGDGKAYFTLERPGIVKYVQVRAGTAPVGAALIVDVTAWDGAAFTSMFTTRPTIADGANRAGAAPDGTYARRIVSPIHGTSLAAGDELRLDVDQVGSGTAGGDLLVRIAVMQYTRALERFLGATDL